MTETTPAMSSNPSQEHLGIEYEQAHYYIRHMYETRHALFNFFVILNGSLLAVIVQFIHDKFDRIGLACIAFLYSLLMTMAARRSLKYTNAVLDTAIELEQTLNLSILAKSKTVMPVGIDSNTYFIWFYVTTVLAWSGYLIALFFIT